jgi:hypothetical protein
MCSLEGSHVLHINTLSLYKQLVHHPSFWKGKWWRIATLSLEYKHMFNKKSLLPRIAQFKASATLWRWSIESKENIGEVSGSSYASNAMQSCKIIKQKIQNSSMLNDSKMRRIDIHVYSTICIHIQLIMNVLWVNVCIYEIAKKTPQ